VLRPGRGDHRAVTIRTARPHGDALLVRFDEVADRTAAEELRGVLLYADVPDDERPDDDEEYYDRQLVGLRARTPDGSDIGEVVDVLHLPGQEVLVVSKLDGVEALVPFVRDLVPTVDLDAATVTIDDRPGLLEEG
jgi:16S rRNA processing protein RimM